MNVIKNTLNGVTPRIKISKISKYEKAPCVNPFQKIKGKIKFQNRIRVMNVPNGFALPRNDCDFDMSPSHDLVLE